MPGIVRAQAGAELDAATLEEVVAYALAHQPAVQQAEIDQEITEKAIKGKLADWYPQVNFAFTYQRFLKLQTSVIGGDVIRFGVNNTSSAQFTATQNIFNRDALFASRTASQVREQAQLNTQRTKIDVVVEVTKGYYDVLTTLQQIKVSEQSVSRLKRSMEDALDKYEAGISDKTDYKRATILLGNARATLRSQQESLNYKEFRLKLLMGYPPENDLSIAFDNALMEGEMAIDTTEGLDFNQHIDYQILAAQRQLQEDNIRYSQWAYLPNLNLFGAYNFNYQNNQFSELYSVQYPFSYVGATLSIPLVQGGKRVAKVQEQRLAGKRLEVGMVDLENQLSTEYQRAISSYKSNLALYEAQRENVALAEELYEIVQLQYQNGIRSYLDVTIAESDLRTTQINYFNNLYQVLSSKLDVMRSLGKISY